MTLLQSIRDDTPHQSGIMHPISYAEFIGRAWIKRCDTFAAELTPLSPGSWRGYHSLLFGHLLLRKAHCTICVLLAGVYACACLCAC